MNLRVLIWKDLRQNARLALGCGIFVGLPYLVALLFGIGEGISRRIASRPTEWSPREWIALWNGAALGALFIATALVAFIGGNAVAGERADRSAEFLAYLPIPRYAALLSKLVVSVGLFLAFWLPNLLITAVIAWVYQNVIFPVELSNQVMFLLTTALLILGVSWAFSALWSSPIFAAAAGVVAPVLILLVLAFCGAAYMVAEGEGGRIYLLSSLIIGPACLVIGVVSFLRRVEP